MTRIGELEKRIEQLEKHSHTDSTGKFSSDPYYKMPHEQPDQPEPRFRVGKPDVVWIEPNGIQLEWDVGERHLEIEIWGNTIPFLIEEKGSIIDSDEVDTREDIAVSHFRKLFEWLFLKPADPPDSCEARCSDPIHKEKFQRTDIKHFCNTCGEEVEPRPKRYWRCGTHKTEYVRYVPPNCALCGKDMVLEEDTEAITASREILKDALLEPTDECEEDGLAREEDKPEGFPMKTEAAIDLLESNVQAVHSEDTGLDDEDYALCIQAIASIRQNVREEDKPCEHPCHSRKHPAKYGPAWNFCPDCGTRLGKGA